MSRITHSEREQGMSEDKYGWENTAFPSMVRTPSELLPGLVCYHVHGHVPKEAPCRVVVAGLPYETAGGFREGELVLVVAMRYDLGDERTFTHANHCNDMGIGEHKYNYNRLFKDRDDAEAYITACIERGIRDPAKWAAIQAEPNDYDYPDS